MSDPEKVSGQENINNTVEQTPESFFSGEERILSDIASGSDFTFKRGNGWAIYPDTGEATYDPKFFEEKGYTSSQSLFAAFHELKCHLVETAELTSTPEGDAAYQRLKRREKAKPWLHIWENWRTDVKGNLAILDFAPSLSGDVETLYKEKLWPERDFTSEPKHLQLIDAVLRSAMIPDEQVMIDPEVSEVIQNLRNHNGRDLISLATNSAIDPLLALKISEKFIEPAIEKLYEQDLQEKQDQQKEKGDGNSGGQESTDEPFAGNYKDHDKKHPQPFNKEEVEKKVKQMREISSDSARQDAGYEAEHGVSRKDVADYFREYREVEASIEPTRAVLRKIVEERKTIVRHLTALKDEGIMIDPGLVTQTYLDVKAGIENPKTMKDFEGHTIPENIPGKAYFYFLYDQSGSMDGQKAILQRRGAIIAAESLKEGEEMISEEQIPDPLSLDIYSAFYGFGSPQDEVDPKGVSVYKTLSKGLTEKQRVALFKGLLEFGRIGTNDYDGLAVIERDIQQKIAADSEFASDLKSGKRKVCVVVTTDGGSNYHGLTEEQARVQTRKKVEDLRKRGIKVKAIAMAPEGPDRQNIQEVYGKDETSPCLSSAEYPKSMEIILADILDTLKISDIIENNTV